MNVLVTGFTGFLGGVILNKLNQEGHRTVGILRDKFRTGSLYSPVVSVCGEIRDYNFIRRVIADYEIEEVYHCAAQAIVRSCANDPLSTYDINVMGTVNLLEACRTSGQTVKSVVVSTSDKAFGHAPIPYTEDTPLNPLHTYETSKACQQLITRSYYHNYGVPTKVVASSNIYGPGDPNFSRIIPNTIRQLHRGEQAVLNDGVADYIREFVYVEDVADAFIAAARKGKSGEVYCCGGTEHLRVLDLIIHICELMGKDPEKSVKLFKKPDTFKEIEKQYIDSSKLRALGWEPKISLDEGLQRSIAYYTAPSK